MEEVMIVIDFRKKCTKEGCDYDKSKTWGADEPITSKGLEDFIKRCRADKFSSHNHKTTITATMGRIWNPSDRL